ncbi:OstA-like protein [Frigoriflavimonas asaccharolytica]|uniref:Lipopolysaccharide assembly outer membrane protein LptD (OstA) n=1 Tax=Frigoriflavimonas asaccharolytica TaxID=2735899 RepID=A0A8J8G8G6_9FLAO|nr:OstA-like protein [Frigoriflavimonas asaccharolytica]NRS91424.1 lipopolysaccharide assembly outer membrane protein LptD (OstA) [Frigoriflavimonas asaccharolytica]
MKRIFLFLLLICISIPAFGQKTPAKDPYFNKNPKPTQNPEDIVQHDHSDFFGVDPLLYDGNRYFKGNVQFNNKGSIINADLVIVYEDRKFIKAIGNVVLKNPDGSIITAEEMEYDGETQKGIARKNVVLQDPKQTIKTDILYYDRISNQAYFNTGGTITTAESTIYSKTATYFTNTRLIDLSGDVGINTTDYKIDGSNIKQNQNTGVANFTGPTTITNKKNPANKVYTESGTYNMQTKEVYLNKNSKIYYNGKTLTGDKLYFNQITGFGTGKGNVVLRDPKENRYIKGDYGEIYEKIDSAMITGNAYAVRILEKDSMYFSAERIITFQKLDSLLAKKSYLRAYKKARFYKSNAQARADSMSFNETDGILRLNVKPILWSGAKQVTGDLINAYFDTKKEFIDSLKVVNNAFAISKVDSLNIKDEFHQVKGKLMNVYYENNNIKVATVVGNAQAITYADDQNEKTKEVERIGVTLTACGTIEALFEENTVQILSCKIASQNNVYPMSFISKEERFFPDFNYNTKDRIKKWQDILVDSPNYPEVVYESDNGLFNAAKAEVDKIKAAEEAKKPKRERK